MQTKQAKHKLEPYHLPYSEKYAQFISMISPKLLFKHRVLWLKKTLKASKLACL
jgi:hypothetical protein